MKIARIHGVCTGIGNKLTGAVKKAAGAIRADRAITHCVIPNKAVVAFSEKNNQTSLKFLDRNKKPFYTCTVDGNKTSHYNRMLCKQAELPKEDVSFFSIIDGGIKETPVKKSTDAPIGVIVKRPDERVNLDISKATITRLENKSMTIPELMSMGIDNGFNIEPVFENLNKVMNANIFNYNNIERVVVSKDNSKMTFVSKNGVSAFMDFTTRRRDISMITKEGLCIPFLSDKKGLALNEAFENIALQM